MIPHDQVSRTIQASEISFYENEFCEYDTKVRVKRLKHNGIIPHKIHLSDAGWDLYATHSVAIMPNTRELIETGIAMAIPVGCVGLIWPRSGLSVKSGIDVLAGVIDSGYRGEIKVCLFNTSNNICHVSAGDRIAQILIQRIEPVTMKEVSRLGSTDRNEGGFGSSDNK